MSLSLRVIIPAEVEEIYDFDYRKLTEFIPDEIERDLASWNARWRKESLEHHIPLGWSYLARDPSQASAFSSEGLLQGYFIAQPLLFFEGHTQSLWVEHLQFASLQARDELCELAMKLAREKHFQRVYFPKVSAIMNCIKKWGAEEWSPQVAYIVTTKMSANQTQAPT